MLAYCLVDPLFIPYLTKSAPVYNTPNKGKSINTPNKTNTLSNSNNNNNIDKKTRENHFKFLQAMNQIESILCVYRESALGSSAWGAGEFVESLQCRPFYTSTVCVSISSGLWLLRL